MTTIAERVAAGAALLDEHEPGWWRADRERVIDLDALSIGSSCNCVFGQVFGHYTRGLSLFHENWRAGGSDADYGFFWRLGGWDARQDEIEDLDAEWRRIIAERRRAEEPGCLCCHPGATPGCYCPVHNNCTVGSFPLGGAS